MALGRFDVDIMFLTFGVLAWELGEHLLNRFRHCGRFKYSQVLRRPRM